MQSIPTSPQVLSEEAIRQTLRQVIDPEVGINIVDLGLVYGIDAWEGHIHISVTMTTPACPMGTYIMDSIRTALHAAAPDNTDIQVSLVWDPPWSPELISADAKQLLGWSD